MRGTGTGRWGAKRHCKPAGRKREPEWPQAAQRRRHAPTYPPPPPPSPPTHTHAYLDPARARRCAHKGAPDEVHHAVPMRSSQQPLLLRLHPFALPLALAHGTGRGVQHGCQARQPAQAGELAGKRDSVGAGDGGGGAVEDGGV